MYSARNILMSALLVLHSSASLALETAEMDAAQRSAWSEARSALKAKHHAEAYAKFMQLANEGHRPSAEFALAMHLHGRTLFDQDCVATPEQRQRWWAMGQPRARQRDFSPPADALGAQPQR